jgi:hypothetical protein
MTRASNFIRGITRIPNVKRPGLKALITLRKMIFSVFGYYLFKAAPAQRKAFFGLLRSAGPRLSVFMPKVIYIFTCYLMDYKRSAYDASVARSHAAWERNNPDRIVIDTTEIPVAEQIRNNATEIFTTAYTCVREKISNRELVYRTVITSMVDYNDRFGDTIDTVDDEQRSYIRLVCERVLAGTDDTATAGDMPLTPPPGFVREILDALDNEVRRLNRS